MRFKTVRGEPQSGQFLQAVVWAVTVVSDPVPGRWWGKPDGGANLTEDAGSQGGTRFKTVRGEPQSGQFLQAVVWAGGPGCYNSTNSEYNFYEV
ncbi:hypothetical protein HAX54_022507 [Datura stramonium]|uniref:Uncharacterized protein n=1 Tax=Datura stramonium TaxID=4076 RepID=A0ABS8UUN0_DATST|nr:hypothetical protein [Datura stramonium]